MSSVQYDNLLETEVMHGHIATDITGVVISDAWNFLGAYAAGTDYAVGDSVSYNDGTKTLSYVMFNNAAAGTLPTNTTYWQQITDQGAAGSSGSDGSDGRNPLTVSATEPVGPLTGDLWYKP